MIRQPSIFVYRLLSCSVVLALAAIPDAGLFQGAFFFLISEAPGAQRCRFSDCELCPANKNLCSTTSDRDRLARRGVWASLIISVSHAMMQQWRRRPAHVRRSLDDYMGVSVGSDWTHHFLSKCNLLVSLVRLQVCCFFGSTEPRTRAPQYWWVKTSLSWDSGSASSQYKGNLRLLLAVNAGAAGGWSIAFTDLIMETRCWEKPQPN